MALEIFERVIPIPACRGGLLLLRKQAEWKVRVVLKDSRHGTPAVKTWGSQHRWSIASKEVWTLGKLQGRDFGIRLDPASHPASHRLNFWTCQVAWFPFDPVSPLTASAPDPPLSPKISPQDQLFVPGFCWGVCQWCLGFGDNLPRPPNSPIPRTMAQRIVPWRCRTAPCVCPPPVAAKTIWLWSCRNWHGPAPCWNSCWDCETAGLFAGWGISMCHRNHVKTIILWPWRMTREPVTFPASDLRFEQPQLPNLCVVHRPLPFADKPAALFLLVDGLRNASASEWCAKRFHTHLLPRLSVACCYWGVEIPSGSKRCTILDIWFEHIIIVIYIYNISWLYPNMWGKNRFGTLTFLWNFMKFQGCTWHRPFGSPWSPWDSAQGVSFRSRRWRAGFGGQRSLGELGSRPTGAGMGWNGGGNFFFGKTHTFRCKKMVKTWFPAKLPWTQSGLVMMDLNLHT